MYFMHVFTVMCALLQTDHHAIGELSADKPQHSLALVKASGAQACQDCAATQRALADFRHRLEVLEANKADRDHNKAQSMPSTQDRSGDTNDDRYGRHGTNATCSTCWGLSCVHVISTHSVCFITRYLLLPNCMYTPSFVTHCVIPSPLQGPSSTGQACTSSTAHAADAQHQAVIRQYLQTLACYAMYLQL